MTRSVNGYTEGEIMATKSDVFTALVKLLEQLTRLATLAGDAIVEGDLKGKGR